MSTTLKELSLIDCGLYCMPEGIEKLVLLEKLDVSMNAIEYVPSSFVSMSRLRDLQLSLNKGIRDFWTLTSLEVLRISSTRILVLPKILETFLCLTELDVDSNPEIGRDLSPLLNLLRVSRCLLSLKLCKMNLASVQMSCLCSTLSSYSCVLVDLDLGRNEIDIGGGQSIGMLLKRNTCLKRLSFEDATMTEGAFRALCEGLKSNRVVEQMNFSWLKCVDDFSSCLADCLLVRGGMKELWMSYCNVAEDKIAMLLAAYIRVSKLHFNGWQMEMASTGSALCDLITFSYSLKELYASDSYTNKRICHPFGYEEAVLSNWSLVRGHIFSGCKVFDDVCKRNCRLHSKVASCALVVLAIHRFKKGYLVKDCGAIIARYLFDTRVDGNAWS